MKRKQNDDVLMTTSFCISEETLERVRKTSRRVGMNPSTFYRFAIVAMLKRFEGDAAL